MPHLIMTLAAAAASTAAQQPAAQQPAPRPTVTRAEVSAKADALFAKSDGNSDRTITKAEVEAAQAKTHQVAQQAMQSRVASEFTRLDTDKNGQLSLAEFRAAAPTIPPAAADASTQVIARLDTNKDGKISIEEYRTPMLAAFDRADTNKDGTVTADERQKAAAQKKK